MNYLNKLLNLNTNPIALVANGQFPQDDEVLQLLKSCHLIIACDGAINQLQQQKISIDYAIGDGDSAINLQNIKHPYIYIPEQDSNDLTKAINFIAAKFGTQTNIIIFAATGLREDHSLANIALLEQYAKQFNTIYMLSDYGVFSVCHSGNTRLSSLIGQQISFFNLQPNNQITCLELKWPLMQHQLTQLNSGSLNQATANYLNISATYPVLIYRAFTLKA